MCGMFAASAAAAVDGSARCRAICWPMLLKSLEFESFEKRSCDEFARAWPFA